MVFKTINRIFFGDSEYRVFKLLAAILNSVSSNSFLNELDIRCKV